MIDESTQPRSPMNQIPTEILCEIFSRCVDQSSVHVLMQPNTKIAPMLLCQVCATWRATVLSVPLLWSHLRFKLPLNWHSNGHPFTWDPELLTRCLEWLRWWRRNLGSMAPYLQVELQGKNGSHYRRGRLSKPVSDFLLEFMSSAQYISVGRLYRYLARRRREAGYVVGIHPKAHTIVATWTPSFSVDNILSCNQYLTSVLTRTRSTLRYLVIESTQLQPQEFRNPLNNWSTFTHLSLHQVYIHLDSWFFFIRSLDALQSGSFHLNLLDGDIETYIRPPVGTLLYLTALHVSAHQHERDERDMRQYPLKAVFDNLQLPALSTLSLESRSMTWNDAISIIDVHGALLSAPSITKLSLGVSFLGYDLFHTSLEYIELTAIESDVEPLAVIAPRLGHLSFVFSFKYLLRRHGGFYFASRIFTSTPWLDLKDPTNTVQEVTLMVSGTLPPEDQASELVDRNLLISQVRRSVGDEVIVRFEEEEPVEVRRAVWGW